MKVETRWSLKDIVIFVVVTLLLVGLFNIMGVVMILICLINDFCKKRGINLGIDNGSIYENQGQSRSDSGALLYNHFSGDNAFSSLDSQRNSTTTNPVYSSMTSNTYHNWNR